MTDAVTHVYEPTDQERQEAKERIEQAVWDELLRVVRAIRVDRAIGVTPELAIKDSYARNGPALVIDEEDVAPLALAQLSDLIGQNLDLRLEDGRLLISSPSWPHDDIPF
jgi:hypothetical protein